MENRSNLLIQKLNYFLPTCWCHLSRVREDALIEIPLCSEWKLTLNGLKRDSRKSRISLDNKEWSLFSLLWWNFTLSNLSSTDRELREPAPWCGYALWIHICEFTSACSVVSFKLNTRQLLAIVPHTSKLRKKNNHITPLTFVLTYLLVENRPEALNVSKFNFHH